MSIAKPIDQLSATDLRIHPIWEYALDEENEHDETYVYPVAASAIPREHNNQVYHVACDLKIATGKSFVAFMSICNGELHDESPVVVGESGEYWPLDPRFLHESAQFKLFFGAPFSELFPMHWQLRVPIFGEPAFRSGVYRGG
jgi:hypothetical protein